MKFRERAPQRRTIAGAGTLAVGAVALIAPGHASMSVPPESSLPAPTVPLTLDANGVFTVPDGSFSARFSAAPTLIVDSENNVVSYLTGIEEDTQSVLVFAPGAFGATPDATAGDRAELFLDASGTDIEPLANTTTRLGPFPAGYFIARLTLSDDRQAVVYGLVVVRERDVVYAFYTDVGGDDNDPASAFVESFAILIEPPPVPTTSTTSTTMSTVPSTAPIDSAEETTTVPTSTDPTATTTSPPAPPSTVTAPPTGATLGYDGRWWVTFPDGVVPAFRASTKDGYPYAEYLTVDGNDTLIVRVTEVPAGFQWIAADVADATAASVGGAVEDSQVIDVDGREAVRFMFAQDDSNSSGDTTQMLVVNGGDQIYEVTYEDGGSTSTADADAFIESFTLV